MKSIQVEEGPLKLRIEGYGYHPAERGLRDNGGLGPALEPDEPEGYDEIRVYLLGRLTVDITDMLDSVAIEWYHDVLMEE